MAKYREHLLAYAQCTTDKERAAIDDRLWKEFGREAAVFVLDMSGFSLLTQKYGVVHYLSMVCRMQVTVQPLIEHHGGEIVKFEADNCFSRFPEPLGAIQAAIAINHTFEGMNFMTPPESDIMIACGIDYGEILVVEEGRDFFGNAVNRASKLGEDIAESGEILVTTDAMALVPTDSVTSKVVNYTISGISMDAHHVEF